MNMNIRFEILCAPFDFVGPVDKYVLSVSKEEEGGLKLESVTPIGDPTYRMFEEKDETREEKLLDFIKNFLDHTGWWEAARRAGFNGSCSLGQSHGEEGSVYEVYVAVIDLNGTTT